jgi:hypothetical protein
MATSIMQKHALVLYPQTERYTTQALVKAFQAILPDWQVDISRSSSEKYDCQYCDYDAIDWDDAENTKTLVNSYMLRKVSLDFDYKADALLIWLVGSNTEELPGNGSSTPAVKISRLDTQEQYTTYIRL